MTIYVENNIFSLSIIVYKHVVHTQFNVKKALLGYM